MSQPPLSLLAGLAGFVRPPLAGAALAEPEAFPPAGLAPAGSAELPCPVSPFQRAHAAPGLHSKTGPQLSSQQLKRLAKQVRCMPCRWHLPGFTWAPGPSSHVISIFLATRCEPPALAHCAPCALFWVTRPSALLAAEQASLTSKTSLCSVSSLITRVSAAMSTSSTAVTRSVSKPTWLIHLSACCIILI